MTYPTDFQRLAPVLGHAGLVLPWAGAPYGLGLSADGGQWQVRSAAGAQHGVLPGEFSLADALAHVAALARAAATVDGAGVTGGEGVRSPIEAEPSVGWPSVRDMPSVGCVCWTHPHYDGQAETWRPRARVVTAYTTIDAFLAAKRAAGWAVEPFDEVATGPDGQRYPVVAVSLTRNGPGEELQDDLLHVWVEPVARPATAPRLEWQASPLKAGRRERYVAAEGQFGAAVWRHAGGAHWWVTITAIGSGRTIREWDAGETRAQASSAAERTLAALNQQGPQAAARAVPPTEAPQAT